MSNFYTSVSRLGNYILWNGYKNGRRFSKKIKYEPTLFVPTKKESEYKALIGGQALTPRKFESMSAAREFVEQYKEVSGFNIYGNTNYVSQFIQEHYPEVIKFDITQMNIASFDIEVDISEKISSPDKAECEITSISYKSSRNSTYHLLGRKDYDKTKTITGIPIDDIQFEKFDSEAALLLRFVKLWTYDYPDVVTGWNTEFFDIPYLINRITKVLGEEKAKSLSPWGHLKKDTVEKFGKPQQRWDIIGVEAIDMLAAFKKFGYKYGPQESYKLDHIAYVVLKEQKVDYSEYGSLSDLYEKNPQLYLDYSLKDTYLIQRMEDEAALIALVAQIAFGAGINFGESFGTVVIWESILYRWQMSRSIVPPIKTGPGDDLGELVGGYVKDPVMGFSDWVVSLDLNSLYPHLMLQYNMSPETYISDDRVYCTPEMVLEGKFSNEDELKARCANGVAFRKDKKGMIPTIIEEYYAERATVKKKMLADESRMELIKAEMKNRGMKVD